MKLLTISALSAAETYIARNARLIDRVRYAHLRAEESPQRLVDCLVPYQNSDGGFGHALEPDLRGNSSQPQHMEVALRTLSEANWVDDRLLTAAGHWLVANSTPDGGVPFVLADVVNSERAFWWEPEDGADGPPANINPTGPIAGLLHEAGFDHPWLGPATEFCWNYLANATSLGDYEALAAVAFLQRVPDRARAKAEFDRLSNSILERVALEPNASGHVHFPLDFAPDPAAMARPLFADSVIDQHLDALIDAQSEDGSWKPNFPMWTPVVQHEWGGLLTVAAVKTLRAYGRVDSR